MNGKIMLIVFAFVIMMFSVVEGETINIKFQPAGNFLYYYDFSMITNMRVSAKEVKSPLIFTSKSSDQKNEPFCYVVKFVTEVPPPDDIATLTEIKMSAKGNQGFWERKYSKSDILKDKHISDEIVFFPCFTKQEYKVGEEWEVKVPLPIVFWNENDSSNHVSDHLAIANQKIIKITNILGYECAEIAYSFTDTATIDSKRLKFECNGKVYFSIKDGIIVSDLMRVEQEYLSFGRYYDYNSNNMRSGKIVLMHGYSKKLRLVKELK